MRKLVIAALLLSGCANMPGEVSSMESEFDGTREVFMEPGQVAGTQDFFNPFNLGAHWTSKTPDTAYLIASVPRENRSIRAEDGLQFNLDGEILSFDSTHTLTEHDLEYANNVSFAESSREFEVPLAFVERLSEAEDAMVKLRVGQTEYREGRLEDHPMSAHRGLQEFVSTVNETSNSQP